MKEFDQLCNRLFQENYTITAREVLYKRYGKDVADSMIAKIKARGRDSYLEKKYVLPDYSNKNLDKIINVVLQNLGSDIAGLGASIDPSRKQSTIIFNDDDPYIISGAIRELKGGNPKFEEDGTPYDLLGHETTHTLQHYHTSNMLTNEIAAVLGEIKRWYYENTGILLDADATDAQINDFIDYCKEMGVFNNVSYGDQIDFEKLLRTSEGKEVFRRIVKQTPAKSDTRVA